ncbi:hypothetical protein CYMTET_6525 [Cymbomonas tetramitiformis]|uniref:Ankyrin repeat domain-containing protein n=1 Tax=Cymbomonas tetramitiformis TaxID=36881 RepID=A0AAE0LHZ1_9CHLO|nr:hypothetical protein CYMTET_6525 [Cymbomonas tetramitiformis]|eukprot:gene14271-16878_t
MWKRAQSDPKLVKEIVNYQDRWEFTNLMELVKWDVDLEDVELVSELIAAGADVNAASEEGERVLNWAVLGEDGSPEDPKELIIKMLAENGTTLGPGYGYTERLDPYQK